MGDRQKQALRVQFDAKLRLEFHGAKVTSDAGLLAFRELDEAFRLTKNGSTMLSDSRRGKSTQHSMLAMLRQSIYGRSAGYEHVNNAERLRLDPVMRHLVGGRAKENEAASTSKMSRFETEMLSSRENLTALMDLSGTWIDGVGRSTAEQWIKEGKYAVKWTRLSCRSFKDNQTRLQLFALAYNLGNFLRRLVLSRTVKHCSLTTLREKLIKIGAKVVWHAKYVTFQAAEVAMPRELFAALLDRIQRFRVPPSLIRAC